MKPRGNHWKHGVSNRKFHGNHWKLRIARQETTLKPGVATVETTRKLDRKYRFPSYKSFCKVPTNNDIGIDNMGLCPLRFLFSRCARLIHRGFCSRCGRFYVTRFQFYIHFLVVEVNLGKIR